ncbi:MAG TPA: spermidine/putrescine ABC transporter substrate-binding protein [Solirubrobacterales bacterium]|jgi:spermidine/putrescine transport system substrate-binding protein|nr:spermidine/putrescine ABC transporter substrate-binding protein [Solirubrobacterales bacterium]
MILRTTPLGGERSGGSRPTRAAAGVLALLLIALAGGCGSSGGIESGNAKSGEQVDASGPVQGKLTISQWPLYIDPGKNGTINEFEDKTGVQVDYIEDINDNNEFFGKLQPQLAKGESGGRDLITVSDWLAKQMYDAGYIQKLDYSKLPNVKQNLIPPLRHPAADPHRDFTVPWQSGMTGLIVNTDLAPNVDSICDLFDPKYKGKVDMLTELRDTVPMTLKCMGIDPDHATTDQWLAAVDKIQEAADSGQIRRFTGNDYIRDLSSGNVDFVLGWSGDAIQLNKDDPAIKFVMPKEGCMLWSTSMEVPAGAPNPAAAEAWMNFVYDPRVQADIAEYVNYVTPVEGVKQILAKRDPKLARSKLIFPTASYTKNCTFEPVLDGEQGREVTRAFNAVVNG